MSEESSGTFVTVRNVCFSAQKSAFREDDNRREEGKKASRFATIVGQLHIRMASIRTVNAME